MPTFLHTSHALDRFRCDLCGQTFPKALIHEHHVIKQACGGQDTQENVIRLDGNCHNAVHQVEMALKNKKRRGTVSDLVSILFPHSMAAQKRCLELAATAALGSSPENNQPDYAAFDSDSLVHLTPTKVSPKVKVLVMRLVKELKNPKTGRKMGVATYIRGLIETDLRRRGML
jgi:hypothetical protein